MPPSVPRWAWWAGGAALLAGAVLLARRGAAKPLRAVTAAQLRAVMPALPAAKATAYVGPLNVAMAEAAIDTVPRVAAFLAQLGHESGDLRYWEELASGDAYEGRKDLGNTQPGDGRRYKGRGPIQLTGRKNYRDAGAALGLPLEARPELAAEVAAGFRVAGWYWRTRRLNALADVLDIAGVSRLVNGGTNGLDDRLTRYRQALRVLG